MAAESRASSCIQSQVEGLFQRPGAASTSSGNDLDVFDRTRVPVEKYPPSIHGLERDPKLRTWGGVSCEPRSQHSLATPHGWGSQAFLQKLLYLLNICQQHSNKRLIVATNHKPSLYSLCICKRYATKRRHKLLTCSVTALMPFVLGAELLASSTPARGLRSQLSVGAKPPSKSPGV